MYGRPTLKAVLQIIHAVEMDSTATCNIDWYNEVDEALWEGGDKLKTNAHNSVSVPYCKNKQNLNSFHYEKISIAVDYCSDKPN